MSEYYSAVLHTAAQEKYQEAEMSWEQRVGFKGVSGYNMPDFPTLQRKDIQHLFQGSKKAAGI